MKTNKKILYIGNNLAKTTKYSTSITILSEFLKNEDYNLKVVSSKINKISRLLDMLKNIFFLRNNTDIILIDTFSTSNFYYAFLTSQLARIFKIKYIPILRGGNLPHRLKNSKFLSNLIFKNSYINVAPSNYLKEEFEKFNFETVYIPNTIPIDKYNFKKRTICTPKLLWVRNFTELYNPKLALLVLNLLNKKYENVKLCMVGPFLDISYYQTLELIKKYNLEDSVEITGVLSKKEWHKRSEDYDIFINTTNYDNTPISVIESMALGLPVVSTNVGGMPYLINNYFDGILVNKNNPIEMSNAIVDIIEGKFPFLQKNAREKAELFDWDIVKNKWKEILV